MATLTEIVKGMEKGADALQGNFESLSNQVNSLATSTYTKTAVNGLLDPIVNGNTIVSGTDLNTVLTPGKYYVAQDDISATLKNSPTKVAFTMTVKKHVGVLQEITEYFPNASARKFYRSINEGIVGPWNQIAVTDQDSSITATWNFTNGFTGGMKAKPWAGPGDTINALINTGLLTHTGMWYIENSSVAPTDLATYIPFASTNFSLIVEPTATNSGRLGVILWDSKQQYSAIVTSGVIGEWVNYKTDLLAYAKTADVNSLISESIANISVGGRNLYLNSKTIEDGYGVNDATKVTVEPFDGTTNMWHFVAEQGRGIVGIYLYSYADNKLPATTDWSYSADIKGTGKPVIFGIEDSDKKLVIGTVGSEWSRISQSGRIVNSKIKTLVMYFNATNSPVDVYIKLPKLETGNMATDWTPAPEDKGPKGDPGDDAVINIITQAQYDALADKSGVYFIEG